LRNRGQLGRAFCRGRHVGAGLYELLRIRRLVDDGAAHAFRTCGGGQQGYAAAARVRDHRHVPQVQRVQKGGDVGAQRGPCVRIGLVRAAVTAQVDCVDAEIGGKAGRQRGVNAAAVRVAVDDDHRRSGPFPSQVVQADTVNVDEARVGLWRQSSAIIGEAGALVCTQAVGGQLGSFTTLISTPFGRLFNERLNRAVVSLTVP
jgi:hypothetical protein